MNKLIVVVIVSIFTVLQSCKTQPAPSNIIVEKELETYKVIYKGQNSSKKVKENIEKAKTEIRRMINLGIVDGETLSNIYKEESEKAINNIMENLLMNMGELTRALRCVQPL